MTSNEARRKLASAGFVCTNKKTHYDEYTFSPDKSPITVRVAHSMGMSRDAHSEIVTALKKAESRTRFEPKPLATLATEFQKAFKEKEAPRYYRCTEADCVFKGTSPEQLYNHAKETHAKKLTPPQLGLKTDYPPELLAKTGTRLKELLPNHSMVEIAKILNDEKFPQLNNMTWTTAMLSSFVARYKLKEEIRNTPGFDPNAVKNSKMNYRFYTASDRKEFIERVRPLYRAKYSYIEIAEELKKSGWVCGLPWSPNKVGNLFNRWKLKKYFDKELAAENPPPVQEVKEAAPTPPPAPKVETPAPTGNSLKVPASLSLVFDDPDLSVQQKLAILAAAKVQIPASLQLVLEDPALNDDQKHRIFLTLMGVKNG